MRVSLNYEMKVVGIRRGAALNTVLVGAEILPGSVAEENECCSSDMKRRIQGTMLGAIALGVVILTYGLGAVADTLSDPDGVPRLVPFRAHLERAGAPVTTPITVEVEVFDAASGGTSLWGPESHTVTPAAGELTVLLGSTVPLPASVLEGGEAWIAMSVDGTLLSGRQRLASAPYAMRAAVSQRAESATGSLATALAQSAPVGSVVMWLAPTAPDGWLVLDGGTIGKTGSGATALADPSAQELFTFLWNNLDDTVLPIQDASGTPIGRGASAEDDFAANRRLPLPNGAGLVPRGTGSQAINGRNKVGPELARAQEDQFQGHRHTVRRASNSASIAASAGSGNWAWSVNTLGGTDGTHRLVASTFETDPTYGTPRAGVETRASSFGVHFIIKL